ncbi:MAG TPA: cadherin domain-containing protein, partial [Burkholderiaceae bacterium]|nr:cadherin domain-containing protein [Burkholderiaceae bacterium]
MSEGAANGAAVGITAASSDIHGGAISYSLANSAGGRFAIDSATGVVTVLDATLLNYETATSHSITVHAQDAGGASSADTSFSIAVTNVAPASATDSDGATGGAVSEGAANGAAVGITASAPDIHGGAISYSLANNAGGRFAIDSATGVVTVLDATLLNYESATSHSITVHAQDASGTSSADTSFTIAVSNVAPGVPTDSNATANSVSEGAGNGAAVGVTASSSDIHGGTVSYSLTDSAGGRFAIDSATGVVTVANATLMNFESATSHGITVRASDGTAFSDQAFAIVVTNVAPGAPTDSNAAVNSVSEGAGNGTAVGITAASSDVHGGALSYSLTDSAGGRFAIDSATGVVTVANATLLNYEAATSHSITVRAGDGTAFAEQAFAIAISDANDNAPVIGTAAAHSVAENSTAVAALTSTDVDTVGTQPATLSVTGGADAARFTVTAAGVLAFVAAPDRELPADAGANNVYDVQVSAFDGVNTTVKLMAVTVTDLNDNAPQLVGVPEQASVTENQTLVTALASSDADSTGLNPALFTITGGADAAFFTVTDSGVLAFVAAPDRETPADADADNVYEVQVSAFDGVNTTAKLLAVTVTDLNDNA